MSDKYIKTKTKKFEKVNTPKIAIKTKEAVVSASKDIKVVMREALVKKIAESKQETEDQKADTEATESVESSVYTTVDTAYHKSKTYVQNKVREQRANQIKTREVVDNTFADSDIKPSDDSSVKIKTREEYVKSQNAHQNTKKPVVKTKEKPASSSEDSSKAKTVAESRREYVQNKIISKKQEKHNIEKSVYESGIKTRESYLQAHKRENVQSVKSPKNKTEAKGKPLSFYKPTRTIKSRSDYYKTSKTQKELTKKASKEAAKRAKQTARKAMQAAKTTAKATAKAISMIAKAVVAGAKALASSIVALGGAAVVVVVLIVIIIVAAIAASPFGIFISDEAADADSIPVSSIVNECNMELSAELTYIEDTTEHDRIVMEGGQADWGLVLSLFSVKVAGVDDETVQDVVVIDESKKQKLKDVFWDMHSISSRTELNIRDGETEIVLYITITAKTKEQMVSEYGFSDKQKEALETLLENADGFIGTTQSLAISDATAQEVINNLPEYLSEERKIVVKKACSLVGKLTYFWGGKSSAIGWDPEWGKMKLVTAEGSRSSGCMRPFGLDCSGFVTWSFINAGYATSAIGHGTRTQVSKGTRISLSSAQPGDLAFYSDISHVGIVGGKDSSGNILVIHCSSGANNVVITTGGFGFAIRPSCY